MRTSTPAVSLFLTCLILAAAGPAVAEDDDVKVEDIQPLRTVILFPFRNEAPHADTDALGAGIARAIMYSASVTPGVFIYSDRDVEEMLRYKKVKPAQWDDPATAAKAAAPLHPAFTMIGSYRVAEGEVRIVARILDGGGSVMKEIRQDVAADEVLSTTAAAAEALVVLLAGEQGTLSPGLRKEIAIPGKSSFKAFALWSKAMVAKSNSEKLALFAKAIEAEECFYFAYGDRMVVLRLRRDEASRARCADDLAHVIELAPDAVASHAVRGMLAASTGDDDTADQSVAWLTRRDPQSVDALSIRVRRAFVALDADGMVALGELSKRRLPRFSLGFSASAFGLRLSGDFLGAFLEYTQAIEISPWMPWLYVSRSRISQGLEQWDRAMDDMDRAVAIDGRSPSIHRARGALCRRMGRFEEAIKEYDLALAVETQDARVWAERAELHKDLSKSAAAADLDKAIELDGENADYLQRRCDLLLELEEYDKALADASRLIELVGDAPDLYRQRADIYTLLGKSAEAEADRGKSRQMGGRMEADDEVF